MMKKVVRRLRKNEQGAALVEFAIVAMLLITLVLGIIEFGWVFNGWIMLTGAAREGARVAAVVTNDSVAIDAALDHTTTFETEPIVTIIRHEDSDPDTVTCEVTGSLRPLVGFFSRNDWTIRADATMRREYSLE